MTMDSVKICVLYFVVILSHRVFAQTSGHSIRIVTATNNNSFVLEVDELKNILNADNLKDRHVVVVSMSGAYLQNENILKNFFIRYLNAQYKKLDLTDWLGENSTINDEYPFERVPSNQTIGISMWSEIFTHDFDNGDKVAIILLDAQGLIDSNQTSAKECTKTFVLSTMLSSVQCYNIKANIREDQLQHLEFLTEYGRLAVEQTFIIPFQKLFFIVRNWPYNEEAENELVDLRTNAIEFHDEEKSVEMQALVNRFRTNFEKMETFFLSSPSQIIDEGQNFTGDLYEIDPKFRKHVKELTPKIFAPENLIVKTVFGKKLRTQDFLQYLQIYANALESTQTPQSFYEAVANFTNLMLSNRCVKHYNETMQKSLDDSQSYFNETDLIALHEKQKSESITQFENAPKIGSSITNDVYLRQIERDIEKNFINFIRVNEEKPKILKKPNLDSERQMNHFETTRVSLEKSLQDFENSLDAMLIASVNDSLLSIVDKNNKIDNFLPRNLTDALLKETNEALSQSHENSNSIQSQLHPALSRQIEKNNDHLLSPIEKGIGEKHQDVNESAKQHNEDIVKGIKTAAENDLMKEVEEARSDFNYHDWINFYLHIKQNALNQFDSRKMGNGEDVSVARDRIERNLEFLRQSMETVFIIYRDCLNLYASPMQKSLDESDSYVRRNKLIDLHHERQTEAMNQFLEHPVLSSSELINALKRRIEHGILKRFEHIKEENDKMRKHYVRHHFNKYGFLKITFYEATAASHADGSACDPFGPCDPYIKLYIDGKLVHQTEKFINQKNVFFGETYSSPRMSKSAPITFELWDSDLIASDDLILSWNTSVEELLEDGTMHIKYGFGENKIVTMSTWRELNFSADE